MKLLAALALMLSCAVSHASTYDIHASGTDVTLDGEFTTSGSAITSFTGTITSPWDKAAAFALVPLGQSVAAAPGLTYTYDNLFLGGSDIASAFDSEGVVVRTAGSNINLFSFGLGAISVYSPAHNTSATDAVLDQIVDGTVTLVDTPAVPEPTSLGMLLAAGALLIAKRPAVARRLATV